jgi:hypothetical protein
MKSIVATTLLCVALSMSAALAQNPPAPAPSPAPTTPTTTGQPASPPAATDKKAIAKACTDQANAKGLHGRARRKFRSACKKNGGNPT